MGAVMTGMEPFTVDICICTFRRGHIAQTLQSLAALQLPPGCAISIIIADNDDTPSARELVETIAMHHPHPIRYLHAPARNISVARNACLDAATASLVAFIDDDELVTRQWLTALVARQRETSAEVILGPVASHYPDNCAPWLRREDFHSIRPVWVEGKIITGYTSNVLFVREAPALRDLRFMPQFGRSGGEDTAFFCAAYRAGARLEFAADAIVTEDVAPERLSYTWLLKRAFRSGQTHGSMLADRKRLIHLGGAAAKVLFCIVMALGNIVAGGRMRYWILRGTLHAGVVARLLGMTEVVQYG